MVKNEATAKRGNSQYEVGHEEMEHLLSAFEEFQTWGFLGDPFDSDPFSMLYLVPQKRLVKPKKRNQLEVDYKVDIFVLSGETGSHFCCRYNYSFDEFQKTNFQGSFKIKICKENKPLLDWIVRNKSVLLINPLTTGMIVLDDLHSFSNFISKHAGFVLPIHDVSALAFNNDYLNFL